MKLCVKALGILALVLLLGALSPCAAQTYSFTGTVKNTAGQGVDGATITLLVGGSPSASTTSDGTGNFTVTGIPSGQPVSFKLSKVNFLDSYTSNMLFTQDRTSLNPYTLFTSADVAQWGMTSGKGVIVGRVAEQGNDANLIAGAVVTATSAQHPGTPYVVVYPADAGPPGTAFTDSSGRYMVLNVDDGDTVTVTATKTGWAFGQMAFVTHADSISQGRIYGTASAPPPVTISASGYVQVPGTTPVPLDGVTVEQAGNPAVATTSDVSGMFTVAGLPSGENFHLKMTKTGYVPTYTRIFNDTQAIIMPRPYSMFTAEQVATFGSAPGKGIIRGAVMDEADVLNGYLDGATVSYTSSQGRTYTVVYSGGGQTTATDGRFSILDIEADDIITVTAAKDGWTFPTRSFYGHTDGVIQGIIPGTGSGGASISASGMVQTAEQTPAPLGGVTVIQAGNPSVSATTDVSGMFTVNGLPSGENFHLKMTKDGYVPIYTRVLNSTSNITFQRAYTMYTEAEAQSMATALQIAPDTSVIMSRAVDQNDPLNTYVSGAIASYTSALGRTYRVAYPGGGNSTPTDGRFFILDVEDGDTVQVTLTKTGWMFPTATFVTHSDGIMMGAIGGTASGGGGDDPNILSLNAGWNLFSIPKQPPDTAIATVLSGILSDVVVVYGYDNELKVWKRYQPSAQDNTLTALEQGKGYWIYLRNAGTVDMTSWDAGSTSVHLYEGWNFVGYSGASAPVETSLANVTGWVVVWTWCEGAWHLKHATLSDLPVPPLDMFHQQKGYWIYMEQGASGDWNQ